jgi:lantibiotic modifying enzyme
MSLFPELDEEELKTFENNGTMLDFNFNTNEFNFVFGDIKQLTGDEALKKWIEKALKTEKNRFKIYENEEFGIVLEDLIIGNAYEQGFAQSEIKREIEEALLKNNLIDSVENFEFEFYDSLLMIKFTVNKVVAQEVVLGV